LAATAGVSMGVGLVSIRLGGNAQHFVGRASGVK